MPDALSLLLRAGSYVGVLQAAGISVFLALFARRLSITAALIRNLGFRSACFGIGLLAARQWLEGARMAGGLRGLLDSELQTLAMRSSAGHAFLMQVSGLVLMAWSLRDARQSGQREAPSGDRTPSSPGSSDSTPGFFLFGIGGAALALLAFTLSGHTATHWQRAPTAALLMLHVSIVAFWIGALWPLYLVSRREPAATARWIVERFSAIAVWIVPCIAVFGAGLAAVLIPGWDTFAQPYGRLVLAKTALFVLLLVLAALNRSRFGPRIARDEPEAGSSFRHTVLIEYALICVVLTVTAVMTMFYSPEPA